MIGLDSTVSLVIPMAGLAMPNQAREQFRGIFINGGVDSRAIVPRSHEARTKLPHLGHRARESTIVNDVRQDGYVGR